MKHTFRFGSFGVGDPVKVLKGEHSGQLAKVVTIEGHHQPKGEPFGTAQVTIQVKNKQTKIHSSHLAPSKETVKEHLVDLVKKVLNEQTKVTLKSQLTKWKKHGYTESPEHSKEGKVVLLKQKGKITHGVELHHDNGNVTEIRPIQRGPISALPKEQQKDYKEAMAAARAAKKSLKKPKGTSVH